MRYLLWFIWPLAFLLVGCSSGRPEDTRLLEISEQVSDSPKKMLGRLDSIDVASLVESDRWFHALMRIKAQDKAYVRHTTDSVILRVMDYYSRHQGSGLYPEALYYGGRVYSDIGDAPSALRYLQDALDALPEGKDDRLRSLILSQTGDLLNSLHLFNEASGYIKNAVTLFLQMEDSLKAMRAEQLLGAIQMHAGHFNTADSCFRRAREIGVCISHQDTVIQDMYLAGTELYRGHVGGALGRIRSVLSGFPEKNRDIVYSYAAQIYREARIPDTAYMFAVRLLESENNDRRKTGYCMLFSPDLRRFSSTDSLLSFAVAHEKALDRYLERHDARQVMMQTALYNYGIHDRERKKAEKEKMIYMYAVGMALIFILLLGVGILYLRNRKMKLRLDYRKSLDNIEHLQNSLSSKETELINYRRMVEDLEKELKQADVKDRIQDEMHGDVATAGKQTEEDCLREQLKEKLLVLQKAGKAKKNDPKEILSALVYDRLQENIAGKIGLRADDGLWVEIEHAVLLVSPTFKSNLSLLIGGRIKPDIYHMALLVRCGYGPTDTGALLGRSKGAVSSRRGYICEKIFGEKYGGRVMDDIINLL